jgi:pilus assembly protein CpaB
MRAVTVSVSAKTGVGGFVFPGDRVDMMLTQAVSGGESGQELKATETILRNLRVLATDQATDTTTSPEGKTEVRSFSTVTLEVTPRIAEKIQVAETIGTISLSLRSIADNQSDLERAIASGAVDVPDTPPRQTRSDCFGRPRFARRTARRASSPAATSRGFQRTTMPRPSAPAGRLGRRAASRGARRADRTDRARHPRQGHDRRNPSVAPRGRCSTARPGGRQFRPRLRGRHEHASIGP